MNLSEFKAYLSKFLLPGITSFIILICLAIYALVLYYGRPAVTRVITTKGECLSNWVGDGFCDFKKGDDAVNCNCDGGDCCLGPNCHCLLALNNSECSRQNIGDGYCNDFENKADCYYDGGDCCLPTVNKKFCEFCLCLDDHGNCSNFNQVGNGICEAERNTPECFYDAGDCCTLSALQNCPHCVCHKKVADEILVLVNPGCNGYYHSTLAINLATHQVLDTCELPSRAFPQSHVGSSIFYMSGGALLENSTWISCGGQGLGFGDFKAEATDECFDMLGNSIGRMQVAKVFPQVISLAPKFDTLWITGGLIGGEAYDPRTDYVTMQGVTPGPRLQIEKALYCFLQWNASAFFFIGGIGGDTWSPLASMNIYSKDSWSAGPLLKRPRQWPACGIIHSAVHGNRRIVVLTSEQQTEILDYEISPSWTYGPDIKQGYLKGRLSALTDLSGKKLMIIGGLLEASDCYSNVQYFTCQNGSCGWETQSFQNLPFQLGYTDSFVSRASLWPSCLL